MTEVRLKQLWKALSPIFVTLEGMLIEIKPAQREKADPPIEVTSHTIPSYSTIAGIMTSPV